MSPLGACPASGRAGVRLPDRSSGCWEDQRSWTPTHYPGAGPAEVIERRSRCQSQVSQHETQGVSRTNAALRSPIPTCPPEVLRRGQGPAQRIRARRRPGSGVALTVITSVLVMEADAGGTWDAATIQEMPGAPRSRERQGGPSPGGSEALPVDALTSGLWHPGYGTIHFRSACGPLLHRQQEANGTTEAAESVTLQQSATIPFTHLYAHLPSPSRRRPPSQLVRPPPLRLQLSPITSDRDAPNTQLCLHCSQPRVFNGSLLPSGQELTSEVHYGVRVISP